MPSRPSRRALSSLASSLIYSALIMTCRKRCLHTELTFEVSPHADEAGFQQIDLRRRCAATTPSGRAPPKDRATSKPGGTDAPQGQYASTIPSVFPAPLILPGDDLALDPGSPPQSLASWLRGKHRNKFTPDRRTLYVASVPAVSKEVRMVSQWAQPSQQGQRIILYRPPLRLVLHPHQDEALPGRHVRATAQPRRYPRRRPCLRPPCSSSSIMTSTRTRTMTFAADAHTAVVALQSSRLHDTTRPCCCAADTTASIWNIHGRHPTAGPTSHCCAARSRQAPRLRGAKNADWTSTRTVQRPPPPSPRCRPRRQQQRRRSQSRPGLPRRAVALPAGAHRLPRAGPPPRHRPLRLLRVRDAGHRRHG